MRFVLSPSSVLPLYKQIGVGLRREIAEGFLCAETRLPSTRQLARDLSVSRITVENAYADLIAEGMIEARPGAGTFVLPPWPLAAASDEDPDVPLPAWQMALPPNSNTDRDRMLRQILRGPLVSDAVSFAWGAGDPRLAPAADFRRILNEVLDDDGAVALGPEQADGYPPLRRSIATYLRQLGLNVDADDILITTGTQQSISMIAATLIQSGDGVVVESPTWPGALDAFIARGATLFGVPMDQEGMCAHALEALLQDGRIRLIYTVPTFHNPTGVVMSASRRRAIVSLAARYGVPVFEDDHVREVRFGSPIPPPLAAFDHHNNVIHASSFTKSFIPALRLGYIVARGPLHQSLTSLKRTSDLFSSTLMQRALQRYLEQGLIQRHWRRVSHVYHRRHTVMLESLEQHFPPSATWSGVAGGLVLWVGVPPEVSVTKLFEAALLEGVSFVTGNTFFPDPNDQPFLRLNFAAVDEENIRRGVAILGRVLKAQLAAAQELTRPDVPVAHVLDPGPSVLH